MEQPWYHDRGVDGADRPDRDPTPAVRHAVTPRRMNNKKKNRPESTLAKAPQKERLLFYCLAAALPLFLLASLFNYSLLRGEDHYLFGADQEILGYIIQAEFLAVASGILVLIPLLVHADAKPLRWLLYFLFAVMAGAFAWLAFELDGTAGMLFYTLLVFVSYGGGTLLVFDWYAGATRTFLSLLRWSMGIFLYVTLQLSFNLESDISVWKNTRTVIPFGASYFYILSVLELILYTPLTYYLEKRHNQDKVLEKGIDRMLATQITPGSADTREADGQG